MFQLAVLEKEVRERAKKEIAKEEQEAEQPIINPMLLITQGNGFVFELALDCIADVEHSRLDTLLKLLQ